MLGEYVLYYDTDSVIYKQKKGANRVELGDYLGDLTNELDNGNHIEEFASGGPKNYCYEENDGSATAKVKGFCLNYEVSEQINIKSMIKLVKDAKIGKDAEIQVPNMRFDIHKLKGTIMTNRNDKTYKFGYDTRSIRWSDYMTFPWGY
eukprot:Lithocolla_globosa_v1_NODE_813_length_3241_cov_10.607031.p1 type:complete len:148 gc:universal NODE_813_length_3241_cov_10.607031:616-173(-)